MTKGNKTAEEKRPSAVKDFFEAVLGETHGIRWGIFKACVCFLMIGMTMKACDVMNKDSEPFKIEIKTTAAEKSVMRPKP